jgi:protein-L-isoaspartate(D-aspartate) O-methyltransferase
MAGLRSDALVEAFARVPRERFLGSGPWQILSATYPATYRLTEDADPSHLYDDVLVAIDASRFLNNGQPSGLAAWFDALDPRPGETVVHVGCGTGYYTAILADIVGSAGRVIAIEIDSELAGRAQANLADLGQVDVVEGDGAHLNLGQVDAIVVNGGATHPQTHWIESLRPGGRLLLPITAADSANGIGRGAMFLVTRSDANCAVRFVSGVVIFPCLSARDPLLNRELSRKDIGDWRAVRSLRREPHEHADSCWLQTPAGCLSTLTPGAPARA